MIQKVPFDSKSLILLSLVFDKPQIASLASQKCRVLLWSQTPVRPTEGLPEAPEVPEIVCQIVCVPFSGKCFLLAFFFFFFFKILKKIRGFFGSPEILLKSPVCKVKLTSVWKTTNWTVLVVS